MARLSYPSAEVITYLYPDAITEAADLGAPVDKSTIVPNGMQVTEFEDLYQQRQQALVEIVQGQETKRWQLAYIARVVPIKGLYDLLGVVDMMVKRGITNFHLDVLGPTDHAPEYYELCRARTVELGLEEYVTFRGTVQVREVLGHFDLLVLPSYNEGQPIVVLEAMTAGIPVVGTDVGGMAQLITDSLVANGGETFGPCGVLVNPGDAPAMADALSRVMSDHVAYAEFARQARDRVTNFFRLDEVIEAYNRLYLELGGIALPGVVDPVVTNMVAIERLHLDARHQAAGEPIDPVLANLVTIERLLTEAGGGAGQEGWVPVGVLWSPAEQRWRPAGDPWVALDGPWVPLHTGPSAIDGFYQASVGADPLAVPPVGPDLAVPPVGPDLTVPPVGPDLTVPPVGADLTVDGIEQDVTERLDPDRADPIRDRLTSLGLIGERPEPARARPDGPPGTG
jgi:hypothetical protein